MSASPIQRNSLPDVPTTMMENVNEDDAQQFQQIIRDRKCKLYYPSLETRQLLLIPSFTLVIFNYALFDDRRSNCSHGNLGINKDTSCVLPSSCSLAYSLYHCLSLFYSYSFLRVLIFKDERLVC